MRKEISIHVAEEHRNLLADSVTGTIRWHKSLGRPHALTLAEGFTIEHEYNTVSLFVLPPNAGKPMTHWVQLPEPFKWDLPEENDEYVVGFIAAAPQSQANHLRVRLAKHVSWAHLPQVAGPGYLRIDPLGDYFTPAHKRVVLGDYRVIHVPF